MAEENALLRQEEARLRETISRLEGAYELADELPPALALPALGALTANERAILKTYFELTNRLLPVGERAHAESYILCNA